MSEDAIRTELCGVRHDVQQLRQEGRERGEKIDSMLVETAQVKVRVSKLEDDNNGHKARFKEIENTIYRAGFWAAVALGGAGGLREILDLLN